jgi:hypothetical protein
VIVFPGRDRFAYSHSSLLPTGGLFLVFMATHRFIGSPEPGMVLAATTWLGAWLCHPEWFGSNTAQSDVIEAPDLSIRRRF